MTNAKLSLFSQSKHQRGVAAIEFAFIAALIILMLLGIFIYWRALQAQQSVTRAAGDGARTVQSLIYGAVPGYEMAYLDDLVGLEKEASKVVRASLKGSGIPGSPEKTNVSLSITERPPLTKAIQLSVSYELPAALGNSDEPPKHKSLGNWGLTEPANLKATALIPIPR